MTYLLCDTRPQSIDFFGLQPSLQQDWTKIFDPLPRGNLFPEFKCISLSTTSHSPLRKGNFQDTDAMMLRMAVYPSTTDREVIH
jgi:hypothetical protein